MSLFEVKDYDNLCFLCAFFWSSFAYFILGVFFQTVFILFHGIYTILKQIIFGNKTPIDDEEVVLPLPSSLKIVFTQALAGVIFGESTFKSRYLTPIYGFFEIYRSFRRFHG